MSRITATCLVQLAQRSGVEMNAYLVLDEKLTRQDIKLKTLSKYVQQHPTGWKKRLELAGLLYATGQWEQAVEEYRRVIKRQPLLINLQLQLGKILHLMGREVEAIEAYSNAKTLTDNIATEHHINGLIETSRRHTQQAVQSFEQATALEPENIFHWLALGLTYLETEAPVEALHAFEVVLKLNPNNLVALSYSYDALMAVGNVEEAQQRLKRTLELFPHDLRSLKRLADYRSSMGLVWGEEGKPTQQMIQTALRLAPEAAPVHDSLAHYHIFRGEWEKGVAVLQQFVEQHPLNPNGWYYYAQCLFHTGDASAAAEAILKAHTLYPKDCEIYRALCEILPDAGKLDRLHPLLEEMLERFPEQWSVWAIAGRVLVENFNDCARGCTVSAKGVELQPQLADAWFRHGRVLALAGRHREAVEVLEQGWLQLPQQRGYLRSVSAAAWLGESYQAIGEEERSRYWWEEASKCATELLDVNPATAHYWQGRAWEALGDVIGAMQIYQTTLSQPLLYPVHREVKEALKRLQTLTGKDSCR